MTPDQSPDERAFAAFVAVRWEQLTQLCWALTGDQHHAEDVAQLALARLWRRWPSLSKESFQPWPYARRIAVNESLRWNRRSWRRREVLLDKLPESSVRSEGSRIDLEHAVAPWLSALPPRQRAVVTLRFMLDLSVADTAETLRCSPGTVKSQSAKALSSLRSMAQRLDPLEATERTSGE